VLLQAAIGFGELSAVAFLSGRPPNVATADCSRTNATTTVSLTQ